MTEVTVEHLNAVRSELHARLAEHKAEVNVTMRELTTEVRGIRAEQQIEHRATIQRLDKLTSSVEKMETGEDREKWMQDLRGQIVKRTAAGLTLAATVGGFLMVLVEKATG
jgi:hypothetical protein